MQNRPYVAVAPAARSRAGGGPATPKTARARGRVPRPPPPAPCRVVSGRAVSTRNAVVNKTMFKATPTTTAPIRTPPPYAPALALSADRAEVVITVEPP